LIDLIDRFFFFFFSFSFCFAGFVMGAVSGGCLGVVMGGGQAYLTGRSLSQALRMAGLGGAMTGATLGFFLTVGSVMRGCF
jgi:hypothetical protein